MTVFSMFYATTRSTLGSLTLDVLLREQLELPSEVTKYPIEDGGPDISDHITQGNETLQIHGSVSASSVEAFEFSSGPSKLMDAIAMLREMHAARQPITIVTGLGIYEDMGFTSLTVSRASGDKGGWWLDIDANLFQIIKVKLEEADLPPEQVASDDTATKGKVGKTEKKGSSSGNSAKPAEEPKMKSTAKAIKDKGITSTASSIFSGGA
jgi:hypothetical protein